MAAPLPKMKITRVRFYQSPLSRPMVNQSMHIVTVETDAGLTGIGYIVWTLRPTPTFSSEAAEEGSPFDTIFKVENTSSSMALANLELSCVLAQVRASGLEPTLVEARDVRLPANDVAGLPPSPARSAR